MATNNLYQVSKTVKTILVNGGIELNPTNGKTVFGSDAMGGLQGMAENYFLRVSPLLKLTGFVNHLAFLPINRKNRKACQLAHKNQGHVLDGFDYKEVVKNVSKKFRYLAGLDRYKSAIDTKLGYDCQLDRMFCTQNGLTALPVLHRIQNELQKEFFPSVKAEVKRIAGLCPASTYNLTEEEMLLNLFDGKTNVQKASKVQNEVELAYAEWDSIA